MDCRHRPNILQGIARVSAPARRVVRADFARPAAAFLCVAAVLALPVTLKIPEGPEDASLLAWKQAEAGGGNSGGNRNGVGNGGGNGNGNGGGHGNGSGDGNGEGVGRGNQGADGDGRGQSASSGEGITQAQFTSGLARRRPVDELQALDNGHEAISFYTQAEGMAGRTVVHRWVYSDSVRYEMAFEIIGDRWRFWSTQTLPRELAGEWTVEIVDDTGNILQSHTLDYQPAG